MESRIAILKDICGETGDREDIFQELRRRAEETVMEKTPVFQRRDFSGLELLRELRISQAELEMQNDELRHTPGKLEAART